MKVIRAFFIIFSAIFGFIAIRCILDIFRPDSSSSPLELLLCAAFMIALTVLLLLGVKSLSASIKEAGRDVIVKTKIVDSYGKTSAASAATRGIIGNAVAGPLGAVVGSSTAKQNRSTTFLIIYKSGRKLTRTVSNSSLEYQKYIKYLDV